MLSATASVIPGNTYHLSSPSAAWAILTLIFERVHQGREFLLASPPTVTAPANQAATEGIPQCNQTRFLQRPRQRTLSGGRKLGATATPDTTFSVAGSSADNVSLGTQTHTYAESGTENPTVTVTNSINLSDSATFQVNVADAPITATAVPVTTAVEGQPFSGEVATFVNANPARAAE